MKMHSLVLDNNKKLPGPVHISLAENHTMLFEFYFSQIIKKITSEYHNYNQSTKFITDKMCQKRLHKADFECLFTTRSTFSFCFAIHIIELTIFA